MEFEILLGKTLKNVIVDQKDDTITFVTNDDEVYRLFHEQDCCEQVYIDDINGDINDLIGHPITMAEEATNHENKKSDGDDCYTWTFYKLATIKGYVNIKFYGTSNGYYSEEVSFEKITSIQP